MWEGKVQVIWSADGGANEMACTDMVFAPEMRVWVVGRSGSVMNKPRIYGILNSRALRPLWAAKECGLDVEQVQVGLSPTGTQSEWFRKINPNAVIPALQDRDFTM